MDRLGRTQQHRADGDAATGGCFQQVVGDVGGVDVRQHQQVGLAGQRAARHQLLAQFSIERKVAVHFAVDLQPGRLAAQQRQRAPHLHRTGAVAAAKVAVRKQGRAWLQAEPHHFLGGHHGDLAQLLGGRIGVDVGVDQEHLPPRQHQAVHARIDLHVLRRARAAAGAFADHLVDVVQVLRRGAPGAAQQPVDLALVQQHRADQRQPPSHLDLGHLHRDTLAFGHAVVGHPEVAVALVVFDVDNVVVETFLQPQAEVCGASRDDRRPADQRRPCQAFVNHHLHRAQDTLFFAFGIRHALVQRTFGQLKDRLHRRARRVDEVLQPLAIGVHVGNRPQRHTRVDRGLRHGRCDQRHQPVVERFRNQVFGAETEIGPGISRGHHVALLGLR